MKPKKTAKSKVTRVRTEHRPDGTVLLDSEQLAAKLGVSPRTLERWAYENKGPAFVKVGRLRRYPADAAERFVAGQSAA